MPLFGRARFGRHRFGHHSTAGDGGAILVGGVAAVSHVRYVYLKDSSGNPLGSDTGLSIVSGSITENIEGLPYASGSIEVRNINGENDDTFYSGQLVSITEVQLFPFAGNALRTGNLGLFKVRAAKPSGTASARTLTLELVSPATDLTGDKVSGDLTDQAGGGPAGLGGGPAGSSVESIASWLLSQTSGGAGIGGGGLGSTPAYTAWFEDEAGVTRKTGPFLIVPPAEATQVLDEALRIIGGYVSGRTGGEAILLPYPEAVVGTAGVTWFDVTTPLTGTVTKVAGSDTLAGSGTAFLTELYVGATIVVPGDTTPTPGGPTLEYRVVESIADDDTLTVSVAWTVAASGVTVGRIGTIASVAPSPAACPYGDGDTYRPIVSVEYAPVEVPKAVVITNSNAVNPERTVTVAVGGGTLKDDVQTFGAFSPPDGAVFADPGDHQTALANKLATRHARRHRTVNLTVLSSFQEHAGDAIELRGLERFTIPAGFYTAVSVTHNIPGPIDTMTLWPG